MNAKAADIYYHLWPEDDEPTMKHCAKLAEILARNVGKPTPWQDKYIWNLVRGTQTPGPKLQKALNKEALKQDGEHPWLLAREITVLSPNGVEPGSVVTGHTTYCPGCGVKFVPNHTSRKWCQICRPPRGRK